MVDCLVWETSRHHVERREGCGCGEMLYRHEELLMEHSKHPAIAWDQLTSRYLTEEMV